ncbi:unnamed protein product [Trichogramma brassicae]|uniref:Uncharacterized protein n=1 Tax=Trichogramma brassicae TaxID=86971 RepID=A0A6H5J104_9HYME|nr:unnamed protein product [Trichogramma brassicae]
MSKLRKLKWFIEPFLEPDGSAEERMSYGFVCRLLRGDTDKVLLRTNRLQIYSIFYNASYKLRLPHLRVIISPELFVQNKRHNLEDDREFLLGKLKIREMIPVFNRIVETANLQQQNVRVLKKNSQTESN